jgi:hypothetical protein
MERRVGDTLGPFVRVYSATEVACALRHVKPLGYPWNLGRSAVALRTIGMQKPKRSVLEKVKRT